MTIVQMPDGVRVDFGDRSPDEIRGLIAQKFPELAAKTQPDQGALNASVNALGNTASFGFMDEAVAAAAAGLDPVANLFRSKPVEGGFGERFNRHLANQEAQGAAAAEQHPIANAMGIVGSLPVTPGFAKSPLVSGAIMGALSGAGNAEGGIPERLGGAVTGGAVGGAVGGTLGKALGAIAGKASAAIPGANAVTQAAERLGIRIPVAAASDSLAVQKAGQAAKAFPFFGQRVVKAGQEAIADTGKAAEDIAAKFGGGTPADAAQAGAGARAGLENWIGPQSKAMTGQFYDAVDQMVNHGIKTPLNETAKIGAQIVGRNRAATLPPGSAVNMIREAASTPEGLTYDGIKRLRTRIGEMLDSATPLPADMSQAELKQIYGALTKDLRSAVANAGGAPALQTFDKANLLNAAVSKRREELMRLLGAKNDEGVFAAIERAAGSTSTADADLLDKARRAMPAQAWDDISSAVVGRLGRDAQGNFSPDRFLTAFGKMSPAGKKALFGSRKDLAAALEDLRAVSERLSSSAKLFGNPSGTAQVGGQVVAWTHPLLALKSIIPAHFLTRALSRPATVRSMTAWAKVYDAAIRKPGKLTAQSLAFASRRFASELGLQFPPLRNGVAQITAALQGQSASPATAEPDQSHH